MSDRCIPLSVGTFISVYFVYDKRPWVIKIILEVLNDVVDESKNINVNILCENLIILNISA